MTILVMNINELVVKYTLYYYKKWENQLFFYFDKSVLFAKKRKQKSAFDIFFVAMKKDQIKSNSEIIFTK